MDYKKCERCEEIANWNLPGMGRPALCEKCYEELIVKYGLKDSPISQKYAAVIKRFREEKRKEHRNSLFVQENEEPKKLTPPKARKSAKDKEIERLRKENAKLKNRITFSGKNKKLNARKEAYPVQYTKHIQKESARWEIKVKNTSGIPFYIFSQPDSVNESDILKCCKRIKEALYMAIDGKIVKE